MSRLLQLSEDQAAAVLAFETVNRSYFATSITDRGDEFFDRFAEGFAGLLDEQARGEGAYYALVADDGSILGRFNLYFDAGSVANLGYRVAQRAAGRGLATGAVRELCSLAAARHGLATLRAAVSDQNVASRQVLLRNDFVLTGPADPADIGGKTGSWFARDVTAESASGAD